MKELCAQQKHWAGHRRVRVRVRVMCVLQAWRSGNGGGAGGGEFFCVAWLAQPKGVRESGVLGWASFSTPYPSPFRSWYLDAIFWCRLEYRGNEELAVHKNNSSDTCKCASLSPPPAPPASRHPRRSPLPPYRNRAPALKGNNPGSRLFRRRFKGSPIELSLSWNEGSDSTDNMHCSPRAGEDNLREAKGGIRAFGMCLCNHVGLEAMYTTAPGNIPLLYDDRRISRTTGRWQLRLHFIDLRMSMPNYHTTCTSVGLRTAS